MTKLQIREQLEAGEAVWCKLRGNSMTPVIHSGDWVLIWPVNTAELEKGDIVFCKVRGSYMLHKVTAVRQVREGK